MGEHPLGQFRRWFADAVGAGVPEPEAACLATALDGQPSARMVLVKSFDEDGFVFYTNYASDKGRELGANPRAALVWRWRGLERQVRVVGRTERTSAEVSDAYFATRERGSQLAAWASFQSSVLVGPGVLEDKLAAVAARFEGTGVPRPPWWGGVRVVPTSVEFWTGRPSRLHDRLRFRLTDEGWLQELLAP